MGVLRLFLAVAVVFDHCLATAVPFPVTGRTAVECFFAISGFYMALVLDTKYARLRGRGMWRTFMASRLVRLYPAYAVVLGATLLLVALEHHRHEPVPLLDHPLGAAWVLLATASNATMAGLDVVTFAVIHPDGGLALARSGPQDTPGHYLLLIPQAWSLSLELCFYLVAPWLVRRSTTFLVALATAGVTGRLALALGGLGHDPWSYRFFPVELSLFLAGVLAYRWTRGRTFAARTTGFAVAGVVGGMLALPALDHVGWVVYAAPYLFALAVPVVFAWSRDNRRDRWVGELSYPLYVVHVLVIRAAADLQLRSRVELMLPLSLVAAVALALLVDAPVERFRQRRLAAVLARNTATDAPAMSPDGQPAARV